MISLFLSIVCAYCERLDKGILFQYRLYGESVVKAAVENGASHIDISGEPAVCAGFKPF